MYCDKVTNNKTKIQKSLFVWGFVLITLIATTAAGANTSTGQQAQIIDKFEVEENFEIQKALAMLGSLCNKNIVPSSNVNGVLAFRSLKNITFEDAMDAILGENFIYEQEGELIKVYTKDEYKKMKENLDRMTYKVFNLYYITSVEAAKLIVPVLSGQGKVASSTAAEEKLSGGSGGSSAGSSGSGSSGELSGGGGGDKMALHETIVVYDYPENIANAQDIVESLDLRPKQVLVEATILSATLNEGMDIGVDLNFLNGVSLTSLAAIPNIGKGTPIESSGFAIGGGPGLHVGVTSGDAVAFITALETITDITIMANPKILAVNKQEGTLHIGDRLGYQSMTSQTSTGTTSATQFLETGTMLTFRPYIGNDGYIRMDIYPKDSKGSVKNNIPSEITTQLRTNILVKDGETIAIGGLFRDEIDTTRYQVPLLGDIPFIGALFRGTNDTSVRKEVIVLLTTHIIEEPNETGGEARAVDISRKRFGAKDGLQWIDRARLAEDRYTKAVSLYGQNDIASAMKELNAALNLRPTYLEAIRLKERIISESSPEEAEKLERIMLEDIDRENAGKWQRK